MSFLMIQPEEVNAALKLVTSLVSPIPHLVEKGCLADTWHACHRELQLLPEDRCGDAGADRRDHLAALASFPCDRQQPRYATVTSWPAAATDSFRHRRKSLLKARLTIALS